MPPRDRMNFATNGGAAFNGRRQSVFEREHQRYVDLCRATGPLPDWMLNAELLPKSPPGRRPKAPTTTLVDDERRRT